MAIDLVLVPERVFASRAAATVDVGPSVAVPARCPILAAIGAGPYHIGGVRPVVRQCDDASEVVRLGVVLHSKDVRWLLRGQECVFPVRR